jgi:hypothetical protein
MVTNNWLFAAGVVSAGAAALHLGCVVGGPSWYRFLGAGQPLVRLAERGSPIPNIYAVGIAAVLLGWAIYAFSGSGALPRLPFLRPVLVAICAIYLLRAAALPVMLVYATGPGRSASFVVWSSIIVLLFGVIHTIGVVTSWRDLPGIAKRELAPPGRSGTVL